MSRTHYVRPGEGRSRVSACGVLCQAGGGPEGKGPFATSRIIYTRCRACVMVLRAERNYLLRGPVDKYGRAFDACVDRDAEERARLRQEGPDR